MRSSENQIPVSENTHVIVLTMETPFGAMRVTSAPMRVSEASMAATDYHREYVEAKQTWPSRILEVTIQRK